MKVTIAGFDSGVMLKLEPDGAAEEALLEAMAGNKGVCDAIDDDNTLVITVGVSNE